MQTIQQMIGEIKRSERLRLSKLINNFGEKDEDGKRCVFRFLDTKPVIATYIDEGAEPIDLAVTEVYAFPTVSDVIRMDGYDNSDRYDCIDGTEICWAFAGQITELADALEHEVAQRYKKFCVEQTGEDYGK